MASKSEACDFEIDSSPNKRAKTKATLVKWTEEEIQFLCDLRSNKMEWENIVEKFPGRSVHSLKSCYQRKIKEMTDVFDPMIDAVLKEEVENYNRRRWENIGVKVGRSAAGCKKRAMELGYTSKG